MVCRALLWQQGHPACFFKFGTCLAEVSLCFKVPLIIGSHDIPDPVHIPRQLGVHWLAKFGDLVLIKFHELCLQLLVVVVNPVHGTLDVGLVLAHDNSDDVVAVVTSCLLHVV